MSLDDMLPEKRTRKPPPMVDLPPLTNMNSDEDIDASMPDGPHDRSKGTTTPVGSDVAAMAASVSQLTPSCSKRLPSPPPSGVGSGGNLGQLSTTSSGDPIVTLFPRRKAGQIKPSGGRGPVVLNLETLEQYYGVPLHVAAKKLVRKSCNSSRHPLSLARVSSILLLLHKSSPPSCRNQCIPTIALLTQL